MRSHHTSRSETIAFYPLCPLSPSAGLSSGPGEVGDIDNHIILRKRPGAYMVGCLTHKLLLYLKYIYSSMCKYCPGVCLLLRLCQLRCIQGYFLNAGESYLFDTFSSLSCIFVGIVALGSFVRVTHSRGVALAIFLNAVTSSFNAMSAFLAQVKASSGR